MRRLENRIPPPIVAALVGVAMWGIAHISPALPVEACVRLAMAAVFIVAGFVVTALGGMAFRRAKTTVNPLKPEAASALVITGVYRYTRNPMYLGFVALLIGWDIYLAAPLALLGPVVYIAYLTRFQIIPEERALSAKFGREFTEYQAKARRWL